MATETLRDKSRNIIGFIDKDSEGKLTLRDKSRNIKGYYDPKTNTTRDKHRNIVGNGNLLAALLINQ